MSSTLEFCKLDFSAVDGLVQTVSCVLGEEGSHKAPIFGRPFWDWQYRHLPLGEAHVYVVTDGKKVLGYYHCPVYTIIEGGQRRRFAVVQDVAVAAELRGRGVFRRLSEFANSDLSSCEVDSIYTFPNSKSIGTFLKYCDYTRAGRLPSAVMPLDASTLCRRSPATTPFAGLLERALKAAFSPPRLPRGSEIVHHQGPSGDFLAPYSSATRSESIGLERNRAYLGWRFALRPSSSHHFLSIRRDGITRASMVLKSDRMFSLPVMLLMDYAHAPGARGDFLDLLRHGIRAAAAQEPEPVALAFTAGSPSAVKGLWRAGFLPVPEILDPRPLNLLVKDVRRGNANRLSELGRWHLTLADWDVF